MEESKQERRKGEREGERERERPRHLCDGLAPVYRTWGKDTGGKQYRV